LEEVDVAVLKAIDAGALQSFTGTLEERISKSD
jgi:hypothetical protein